MPASRAASSRGRPSSALASASRRALTHPSRSRRARRRSSAGSRSGRIGKGAGTAAPPGRKPPKRPRRPIDPSSVRPAGIKQALKALAEGAAEPAAMADLARGRMRRKLETLAAALDGQVREHHRFLIAVQLRRLEAIARDLGELDARIEAQLEPFRAQHRLLMRIPGVDRVVAAGIIAEVGVDMDVFATAQRLAAWAGLAPGNHESAGRRKGAATRKGNVFLKATLFAAANAAVKTKGSYYRDKYHRLRARRGPVRALVAVAHKLLIAAFHMLRTGSPFRELGEDFLDRVSRKRSTTKLVRRLAALGYDVLLVPKAA